MARQKQEDLFLSSSAADRYSLYQMIQATTTNQLSTAQWLETYKAGKMQVTAVNLRQIAKVTGRNYGSIYNMYNDLVTLLTSMTGKTSPTIREMFAFSEGQVRMALVEKSHAYAFIQALLKPDSRTFDEFLEQQSTSKVTMLRHLQPLKQMAAKLDVKVHYEKMKVTGDERCIRIFLTFVMWLATDGAKWPFTILGHQQAHELVDNVFQAFDIRSQNQVATEVAMYYLAISFMRMAQGHLITYSTQLSLLNYPVPNLFNLPSTKDVIAATLPPTTREVQLGESTFMYFLANFTPAFVSSDNRSIQQTIERFKRYNSEIYQLVTSFLAKLPESVFDAANMSDRQYQLMVADMLAITVGTLTFHMDINEVIAYTFNHNIRQTLPSSRFTQKVQQTLENVLATEQFAAPFTEAMKDLTTAYSRNLGPLLAQAVPPARVKVLPLLEQAGLGYVDLYTFLFAQPFVQVLPSDATIEDADLVIQAAALPHSAKEYGTTIFYHWELDSSNDLFGNLYALLRELWQRKMAAASQKDAD